MNEVSKLQPQERERANQDEDTLLEIALHDPDRLLSDSLRVDERRRRTRRIVSITLIAGGIVMGTILVAVLAGWLTLAGQQAGDSSAGQPQPGGATATAATGQQALGEDARIEQGEELTQQGWQLWQERNFSGAASKFEEAVTMDAENANAWNGLGWARFNSGESEAAVPAFEKCVELEPEHPAGLNGLGQVYLSWGEFETAEKYLTKAAPKATAAHYGLARLYLLTGDYEKAQRWIRRALRGQPGDETLKAMLVAARKKELPAELNEQIAPVGKPQKSPPNDAAAAGWRLFNEGKFRAAERSFKRALAKDPENLAAMNGLGFILLNSGRTAQAKEYFEKYLKVEPEAPGPMNGLARCLKEEGKVDEAIALWEKMYEKYPGPNAAAVGLAMTHLERKEHAKALPYFEELVKSQPDNEEFKKGLEAAKQGSASQEE
ncbi:MAG TPA: tetratricopeptide repeat protein [Lacipirellulaceae bacterium]